MSENLEVELFPLPKPKTKPLRKTIAPAKKKKKVAKGKIYISHTMHVSTMVRKYLETIFQGTYRANQADFVGMWLINALTKKTKQVKVYVKKIDIKERASRKVADVRAKKMQSYLRQKDIERWGIEDAKKFGYLDSWKFTVPERYRDSVVLPKRRVVQFNNMILKFMYAEMFTNMEARRLRGEIAYIQTVIYEFRAKYKINDNEFTDERVRKAYLRYRENSRTSQSEYTDFFAGFLLKY